MKRPTFCWIKKKWKMNPMEANWAVCCCGGYRSVLSWFDGIGAMTDARLMGRERSVIIDYPFVGTSCIVHTRFDISHYFLRWILFPFIFSISFFKTVFFFPYTTANQNTTNFWIFKLRKMDEYDTAKIVRAFTIRGWPGQLFIKKKKADSFFFLLFSLFLSHHLFLIGSLAYSF